MNPLMQALLRLDWWTDALAEVKARLAADPHNAVLQADVDDARERYEHWYAKAAKLDAEQDERDAADEWLEEIAP